MLNERTSEVDSKPGFNRQVLGSRFKAALTNRTDGGHIFGTEFVVKYGHAKHEIEYVVPNMEL